MEDGNYYHNWDIRSIGELRWVLKRTTSTIGLTVKRGDKFFRAVARYVEEERRIQTPLGMETIKTGRWMLEGPTEMSQP